MLKTERKIHFNSSFTEGRDENNKNNITIKKCLTQSCNYTKNLYIYIHTHTHTHTYIYAYKQHIKALCCICIYIYIYMCVCVCVIKMEFIKTLWGTDRIPHSVEIYKIMQFSQGHTIVVRTKLRNRSFILNLFWHHVPLQLYPHFVFIFNSIISWIIHLYTLYSSTFITPSTLVNLTSTTTILLKLFIIFYIW